MANVEKELFKFVNDPKYREKVIARIQKKQDSEYNRRIKNVEQELEKLSKNRVKEIERISNARWEELFRGKLFVNRTEGKIRINGTENLFSSIQGAELNMITGCRIVTTDSSKSKKHASVGGAMVGHMVAGRLGAVVGGSTLGKTKTKSSSVSNQIPTCTHLGVMVKVNGFVSEVVFISYQVDQSSMAFSKAQCDAQNLILKLDELARTSIPTPFLRPDEEDTVKAIDIQIENKQQELQDIITEKPSYSLPDMYRMSENKEMSDEEYIKYLYDIDKYRKAEKEANEAAYKQKKAEKKAADRARYADGIQCENGQSGLEGNLSSNVKIVGGVIGKLVFWIMSAFFLLFAIVSFTTNGGILSGTIFSLTAVGLNPILARYINTKGRKVSVWIRMVIMIVGFIAGIFAFPTV